MKKSIIIWCHILFWLILFFSSLFNVMMYDYEHLDAFRHLHFADPVFFYIGYFCTMKLLKFKKIFLYVIIFIFLSYMTIFFISLNYFAYAIMPFYSFFTWFSFGVVFRFFVDWFQKRNGILSLEKENAESKLALLRTQINPHFLFNTLNNIDSLIKDNPENASQSLSKLSDIMRYMLKDEKIEKVLLSDEIEFIKKYVSLEQLRLKNDNFFKMNIVDDCNNKKIAPMMLIPFVENAFKHSVDSDIENGIMIDIVVAENKLTFICENKFYEKETEKDMTHGIGLDTVRKRLNMIYPNKHNLKIITENSLFNVKLEIYFDEN